MFPKWAITLVVAILWVDIDLLMDVVSATDAENILVMLIKIVERFFALRVIEPLKVRSKSAWMQQLHELCAGPSVFLWTPLMLLGFFLLKDIDIPKGLTFCLMYFKLFLSTFLIFRLHYDLVTWYGPVPPDEHPVCDKPPI